MWKGNYSFFDYKYNIEGYHGEDYMSSAQYISCAIGMAIAIVALIILRNTSKEKSKKILLGLGIFMTVLYIAKTSWESYYDITKYGEFNLYILPFDLCSLIMPALIIAGCTESGSKLERYAALFISTNGFAGGIANMIFLRGLNYYPLLTFGAMYSLIWHVIMIFTAFYIPLTRFIDFKWIDIPKGMVFILAASIVILPFDYIMNYDFMLINGAGGVPVVEDIASKFIQQGLRPLATISMYVAYLAVCTLMISIYKGITLISGLIRKKKRNN